MTHRGPTRSTPGSAAGWAFLLAGVAIGVVVFRGFPDRDIALLGPGYHRYFAFHSALVPLLLFWAARGFERPRSLVCLAEGVAAGAAAAFAIHLFLDSFQSHPVKFPFVGSLIDGTSLDDRLWLFANSLASAALGVRIVNRRRLRRGEI